VAAGIIKMGLDTILSSPARQRMCLWLLVSGLGRPMKWYNQGQGLMDAIAVNIIRQYYFSLEKFIGKYRVYAFRGISLDRSLSL
jgi:hypothetical protein